MAGRARVLGEVEATLARTGLVKLLVRLAEGSEPDSLRGRFRSIPEGQQASLASAASRMNVDRGRAKAEVPPMRYFPHLRVAVGYADADGFSGLLASNATVSLAQAPELSLIRPVATRLARGAPREAWGPERLGAEALWEDGITGAGVAIGHLDTGVDGNHPALQGRISAFAMFDLAGNEVPGVQPHDSDRHGTHTAGILVGKPPRGRAFGVAPGASLASAMVIEGGQVIDRILAGIDWVIERRARVLNMSLGLRGHTAAFEEVIDAVRGAGVLPVIAIGNEGPNTSRSPGNYPTVLSVGAFAAGDVIPDFSGSQRFPTSPPRLVPTLVAPGVAIRSCLPGGAYGEMDGTSMAAPHVAGLAALLFQACPDATADQVETALIDSCRLPRSMPVERGSLGVPDAGRALRKLRAMGLGGMSTRPAVAAARPAPAKPAGGAARPGGGKR